MAFVSAKISRIRYGENDAASNSHNTKKPILPSGAGSGDGSRLHKLQPSARKKNILRIRCSSSFTLYTEINININTNIPLH